MKNINMRFGLPNIPERSQRDDPFDTRVLLTCPRTKMVALRIDKSADIDLLDYPDTLSVDGAGSNTFLFSAPESLCRLASVDLAPGVSFVGEGDSVLLPPTREPGGDYYAYDDARINVRRAPSFLEPAVRAALARNASSSSVTVHSEAA